jgi:NAD(P)-dependent dehydrogenase (short-subunit alcohol dehydrogenase family)
MNELKDKVAIVTGASRPRGIGHAIAKRFARAGASVLLVADATAEQLAAAVQECRAFPGAGRIESALIDLGRPGAPEDMAAQAERLFGRIDVLVNNAAIRASVDFGEYTRDQFDRVVAVNLAAPFFASQAVLPVMRRQGGGRILHMASQLGHVTFAQRALYGLTKAALIHLTKSMAYELARDNIIVNAISPGPIATGPILANDPEVTRKRVEQYVPAGRLGEPEEIADLALYLAASSPPYLRGQDIVIDGGYIIH